MSTYKFKAVRSSGEAYEGTKEAPDKGALAHEIKKAGDTLISAEAVEEKKKRNIEINIPFFNKVKTAQKIAFAKNLAAMVDAGLPLTRALSVMERQSGAKSFKKVLTKLIEEINKGSTLSQAMTLFPLVFSELFVSMVRSGEESGSLTAALRGVGGQLEKSYLLYKKVKGAMMYPAIVITVMIVIGILMLVFLVPILASTFKELNLDLPLSTRTVIFLSDFLKNNTLSSFGILVAVIFGVIYFKKTQKGKAFFDYVVLRLPIIGNLVKETNSARTARTLSSLLSVGVEFLKAIEITESVVQNIYYKKVLKRAAERVGKGGSISSVFMEETKLYPIFVGEMASIGEETGKLSMMFGNVAEFYENEVEQKTKDMSTVIEPFLMVFIGVAVGFFAISMLGPTYSLVDAI